MPGTETETISSKTEAYNIRLPVFEGPLDLLLHLIKKNKIDIYDIPIAEITRQYLEYIEIMKELNLEIAGEFLVMAATLVQIKTRMLLPVEEDSTEEEPEDPRWELVERLLEYQAIKVVSQELSDRYKRWERFLWRGPIYLESDGPQSLSLFDLNAYDLYEAFRRVLERAHTAVGEIAKEPITVKQRMDQILKELEGREIVRFEELFRPLERRFLIITFIALLELASLRLVRVFQEEEFGPIWVSAVEKGQTLSVE